MAITAKELAAALGLSEAAVSMALHNKPGVSAQTRRKVMESAKEKGYDFSKIKEEEVPVITNGTIFFLIYRKHGAVVADTPFFSQLSEGIDAGCKKCHFHLNVYYLYEDQGIEAQLENIIRLGCKGIVLLGTEMKEDDFSPFRHLSVPLVMLDNYIDTIDTDCVLINNIQGASAATNYLISRIKSQPGYLRSSYEINNFAERADGFYKAIRQNGMSTSATIVHQLAPSMEGAYADMLALLARGEKPAKCYFADNDLIAAGAMRAFKDNGYRIPEDISIIGFDNMPLSSYVEPALTTIHVPKQYMGEMAVLRLAYAIENSNSKRSYIKMEISTTLVKRGTVR